MTGAGPYRFQEIPCVFFCRLLFRSKTLGDSRRKAQVNGWTSEHFSRRLYVDGDAGVPLRAVTRARLARSVAPARHFPGGGRSAWSTFSPARNAARIPVFCPPSPNPYNFCFLLYARGTHKQIEIDSLGKMTRVPRLDTWESVGRNGSKREKWETRPFLHGFQANSGSIRA